MKKTFRVLIAYGIVSNLTTVLYLIIGTIRTIVLTKRGVYFEFSSITDFVGRWGITGVMSLHLFLLGLLLYCACKEKIKAVKIPASIGIVLIAISILVFHLVLF